MVMQTKKIPQVVKKIRDETNFEACNYLAFIDNQGFNVEWKAMKELLKPYGDLLINFQTGSNAREWGNAKSGNSKSIKKLNNFFGVEYTSEDWSKIEGRDGLRELYMKMLKNNGRPVQEYIKVKGRKNKSFHYDMIYCTRETSMGSPYKKVIEDIKPKIERHTGDSVEKIIDIMKGKHSSLDYFYETEKDKDQKELGDF